MSTIGGKENRGFRSGGEEVTEDVVLGEVKGKIKGEGTKEGGEEMVGAGDGGIRKTKERMIREPPRGPSE